MSSFSFSFSGDDIEDSIITDDGPQAAPRSHAAETGTLRRAPSSAFPIAGQPLLAPRSHDLESMLKALPSNIAYSTLVITLDDGKTVSIPRRELWDVRAQLMAEEDDEGLGNLGKDDVRTGVYEGGFKSWESSVDVVKVLYSRRGEVEEHPGTILELGCGTALPSVALFQWLLEKLPAGQSQGRGGLNLGLADYNPTVLQMVTLPNLLLSWAQIKKKEIWDPEGELEVDEALVQEFLGSLESHGISISFFSGAWSSEFVHLAVDKLASVPGRLTIIGAETIYSPAALKAFADTLIALLETMPGNEKIALIAAKKVYFGVGGSMEDFCNAIQANSMCVEQIREESDGVRRAVVEVRMPMEESPSVPSTSS